jgi:hypothetical protein
MSRCRTDLITTARTTASSRCEVRLTNMPGSCGVVAMSGVRKDPTTHRILGPDLGVWYALADSMGVRLASGSWGPSHQHSEKLWACFDSAEDALFAAASAQAPRLARAHSLLEGYLAARSSDLDEAMRCSEEDS